MPTSVKLLQGQILKEGDTAPNLRAKLIDPDGTPKDLSNTNTVHFYMRQKGDTSLSIDGTASIVSASNGIVTFDWADDGSDLGTAGEYEAEFEVDEADGETTTFPGDGRITLEVREALK